MSDFEFRDAEALALLVLVVPVAWLAWRRRPGSFALPSGAALESGRRTVRSVGAAGLPALRILAVVLIVVGLARPRVGEATAVVQAEGIDIVLAIDLSSSMTTGRFADGQTRLEVTLDVVRDFIAGREDDRIGLVVFQKDAIPLVPPTLDHAALDAIVAELDSGRLPDGTGIGVGLGAALNMLQESASASRVVILLTDGEHNTDSIGPLEAAGLASALSVRVYTIGVGPESQPGRFGGIDIGLLREIADRTGGRYFNAETPEALEDVYQAIGELETSQIGRERFADYDEFGPLLLALAAACVLAEVLLRGTWLRRLTA